MRISDNKSGTTFELPVTRPIAHLADRQKVVDYGTNCLGIVHRGFGTEQHRRHKFWSNTHLRVDRCGRRRAPIGFR